MSEALKKAQKIPTPAGLSRKSVGGFKLQTAYVESYDYEIESNAAMPLILDDHRSLIFDLPVSDHLHVDLSKSSLALTFSIIGEDKLPPDAKYSFTVTSEPLLSMIRRITCYSKGKTVFTQQGYNTANFISKLQRDQNYLNTNLRGLTGYGIDKHPKDKIEVMESPQLWRKSHLRNGNEWSLRGPLDIFQFGTNTENPPMLPCSLALQFEIEFEKSDFIIFRDPKKSEKLLVRIPEVSLWVNLKALNSSIPKNWFNHIEIPFQDAKIYEFMIAKGEKSGGSGQLRLENTPTRAIVYIVDQNSDTQMGNPYNLAYKKCKEIKLDLNGKTHQLNIEKPNKADDVNLYYNLYRTLGLENKAGWWGLKRDDPSKGMFLATFDLTCSGLFDLGILDSASVKNPSIVAVDIAFKRPLDTGHKVIALFFSTAKTVIHDGEIDIQYF